MPTISDRLIEGRKALGLSQQALADRAGISARSQRNYESGERSPDADYLAAVAAAGVDVLYLLTGVHTSTHIALSRVRAASEAAGFVKGSDTDKAMAAEAIFNQLNSQLPADEQMWLETYREWSAEVKKRELRRAMGLSPTGVDQAEPVPAMGNDNQFNSAPGAVQIKGTTGAGRDAVINTGTGSQTVDKSKHTAKVKGGFMNMAIGSIGRKK